MALAARSGAAGPRPRRSAARARPRRSSRPARTAAWSSPGSRTASSTARAWARRRSRSRRGPAASDLAIDIGVNGVAYVVWTQNGDVRAARLGTDVEQPCRRRSTSTRRTARAPGLAPARRGRRRRQRRSWCGGRRCRTASRTCSPAAIYDTDAVRRCRRTRRSRAARPTRRRSTSSSTARTPGSRSGRPSAACRARSPGACARRPSRCRSRSTAASPAPSRTCR